MKTLASFAWGAALATGITLLTGQAHHTEMLEHTAQETHLRCAEHYRQLLADTHALYQARPERCLEIETTDMSARELLWHLEALCETGIIVHMED